MSGLLSAFQHDFILSVCPRGSDIVEARFVREWLLPCPMRVKVAVPGRETHTLILRLERHQGGVERETALLPVLARLGLPVATILAGPVHDPAQPELGAMSVITLLPGEDLLVWSQRGAPTAQEWIEQLVLEAVNRLQELTAALECDGVGSALPRRTLLGELEFIPEHAGSWCEVAEFHDVVRWLMPLVAGVKTPLVFSNGDYNPANFLSDGQQLTGIVDFAGACFEDPYFGLAKYSTFAWLPFDVLRLIERFRTLRALSTADFALRIAVACLWTLQNKENKQDNQAALMQQLREALVRTSHRL